MTGHEFALMLVGGVWMLIIAAHLGWIK